MGSLFTDTPEELDELRIQVTDWLKRAQAAVKSFHKDEGHSFWRDSRKPGQSQKDNYLNATTTARAYLALAVAHRVCSDQDSPNPPEWAEWFRSFCGYGHFKTEGGNVKIRSREKNENDQDAKEKWDPLTHFDLAHIADLHLVRTYLGRFYSDNLSRQATIDKLPTEKAILGPLWKCMKAAASSKDKRSDAGGKRPYLGGEIAFERVDGVKEEYTGHHFFVTLHGLRAFEILRPGGNGTAKEPRPSKKNGEMLKIVEDARRFCIEQCFHAQRPRRYQRDTVRAAFAGVIYCLYANRVDGDLALAITEALAAAQQDNGSWPATHPIFRRKSLPWHITSHEIALCLTWLYFQPQVPDDARLLLLLMMRKYFLHWVKTTFVRVSEPADKNNGNAPKEFTGWFDDHTIKDDYAVGWATAIVCHFLANYHEVLSDHINRRVIESLEIQSSAKRYLIDETSHACSKRWQLDDRATWPDIPPFAWEDKPKCDNEAIYARLAWEWADPSEGWDNCKRLSEKVIAPVLKSPGARPKRSHTAGILPGSPGTGKTTLVNAIAKILRWPMVAVPASVIFDRGFDLMETRANEVFRRLSYLSKCVIFFDEFEEFFRDRGEGDGSQGPVSAHPPTIHDRTIAAFTTSAMLPRLQDLHDKYRCLILFATNHLEKVDPAIRRSGRFDFKLEIGYPDLKRLKGYLDKPARRAYNVARVEVKEEKRGPENDTEKEKYSLMKKAIAGALDDTQCTELMKNQWRFSVIHDTLSELARAVQHGDVELADSDRLKEMARKEIEKIANRLGASENPPGL